MLKGKELASINVCNKYIKSVHLFNSQTKLHNLFNGCYISKQYNINQAITIKMDACLTASAMRNPSIHYDM